MYASVREFVSALSRAGELLRITAPVSPVLEIAALADRASKSPAPHLPSASARRNDPRFHHLGGPAMLLTNVAGADMPVLINAYGSYRRMEMALGCHDAGAGTDAGHTPGGFDALADKIAQLVKPEPPKSLGEILAKARQFLPLLKIPPRRRRGMGPCQEIILTGDRVDLTRLPIIRCWPHDGDFAALGYPPGVNDGIPGLGRGADWDRDFQGRYITLAGIHTIHADDLGNPKPASHNIGMYRVQLLGPRRMAMHWHMHHDGARHWRSWKKRGKPMPVAVALGGQSILPYAATAPLPPGISELLLAGFLNRGGIPMVMGRTVPIWVPADAEIVIEGFVSHEAGLIDYDPRSPQAGPIGPGGVFEGPFGDHTGFYSLPDRYPIFDVTAITHRRDPIYPTTVVGLPPQEDYFLGKATERIFLPLLKTLLPDIEDYDLPLFGAFHNCAFLKIRKQYPLHARRVMHGVWGAGQMSWTKTIFVVDHDTDVHDARAVLAAAAERCHPGRDLERVHGPLDILDHAAPHLGAGTKLGFDATPRIQGEQAGAGLELEPLRAGMIDPAAAAGCRRAIGALPGVAGVATIFGLDSWVVVRVDKQQPQQGRRLIERIFELGYELGQPLPAYLILVGPDVEIGDSDAVLFHWCAHADAGRDALSGPGCLAFDATPKLPGDGTPARPVRPWPPMLRMPRPVVDALTARAAELGLPAEFFAPTLKPSSGPG